MEPLLITPAEIQEILDIYHIGKKPLAALLGWGEATIIRYLDGDSPSREYSEKLKEIKHNPAKYYELLLANAENITRAAYHKSRKAIEEKVIRSKAAIVMRYIMRYRREQLPKAGYQSIAYFSQGFHLAMYGRVLFDGEYKLSQNGMPYENLEDIFYYDFPVSDILVEEGLKKRERELLQAVSAAFSWYGMEAIAAFMKEERDMLRISRNKENERIFSYDAIEKHFKWVMKEYRIFRPEDISKYVDFQYAKIRGWKLLSTW